MGCCLHSLFDHRCSTRVRSFRLKSQLVLGSYLFFYKMLHGALSLLTWFHLRAADSWEWALFYILVLYTFLVKWWTTSAAVPLDSQPGKQNVYGCCLGFDFPIMSEILVFILSSWFLRKSLHLSKVFQVQMKTKFFAFFKTNMKNPILWM